MCVSVLLYILRCVDVECLVGVHRDQHLSDVCLWTTRKNANDFHCCDQELITSSNIADNAMRLQMVTHPSNFRSQCCSYMDVFYHFIYAYCVRECARACVRVRARAPTYKC